MFSVVDEWEGSLAALEDMTALLVGLFQEAVEPSENGALLEEVFHWGAWGLSVWPHPSSCSLSAFVFVAEDMSS